MSLIVGIRAAEGLVLATDSLTRRDDAVYLTARKLFTFPEQPHVAVAVCGLLSLGHGDFRPITVLMEEFHATLRAQGNERLATFAVAQELGALLKARWETLMLPEDEKSMTVIVAGFDAGFPYGEFFIVEIPDKPEPRLYRAGHQSFFAGFWGDTAGARSMVEPHTFPFAIMPMADCATLAEHLITSTAQLEAWSSARQQTGGTVQLVTITQADGARWEQNPHTHRPATEHSTATT